MRIVFFGTPDYVLPIVKAIYKEFDEELIAVVTQPPKHVGRGRKRIVRSPIDTWAFKKNIEVVHDVSKIPRADLGVLAAYGKFIPEKVLKGFVNGILNIHPSKLPKLRGASPIQASILSDSNPAVTVIRLDEKMDHGPIISQFQSEKNEDDTAETLRKRLFEESAQFLIDLIPNYLNGKIKPKMQNHKAATYTKLITKEDGFVPAKILESAMMGIDSKKSWEIKFVEDFKLKGTPENIDRLIKAMHPWPGVWTLLHLPASEGQATIEKRLKIIKARLGKSLVTKNTALILEEVQLEGKNKVDWELFKKGYPNFEF